MQISATTNADDLKRRLNNTFARQLPFATARALTATAHDMRKAERGHMARIFDRPTNWTLNAFEVVPAQRKDPVPTAEVRFKYTGSRVHYLQRHIEGGPRELGRVEARILAQAWQNNPAGAPFEGIIPARAAKLDRYGNWSAGERNRVLSALQLQIDPTANETAASRSMKRRCCATTSLRTTIWKSSAPAAAPTIVLGLLSSFAHCAIPVGC